MGGKNRIIDDIEVILLIFADIDLKIVHPFGILPACRLMHHIDAVGQHFCLWRRAAAGNRLPIRLTAKRSGRESPLAINSQNQHKIDLQNTGCRLHEVQKATITSGGSPPDTAEILHNCVTVFQLAHIDPGVVDVIRFGHND